MWDRIKHYDQFIEAVFWIVQLLPAVHFGYIHSGTYISLLSVYALVKGCMAAHHAKMSRKEDN